VQRRWRMAW